MKNTWSETRFLQHLIGYHTESGTCWSATTDTESGAVTGTNPEVSRA
ncbi:hypothetical protein NG796_03695 [Laspinema sp. A4]|nr:hypothetical protein [Laspinema sp. D2d]